MAAVQQLFFQLSGHGTTSLALRATLDRSPVDRSPAIRADELLTTFDAAYSQDAAQTIRMLLYVRDKKDGLGMRQLFCTIFMHLWRRATGPAMKGVGKIDGSMEEDAPRPGTPRAGTTVPLTAAQCHLCRHQLLSLLPRIPDYGSWKDLVLLAQSDATLRAAIVPLFAAQLQEDRLRLLNAPPTLPDAPARQEDDRDKASRRPGHRRISTAAKWFPSTHSKYRNSPLVAEVRAILGLTEATMRKNYLSPLRAHLALIEHELSQPGSSGRTPVTGLTSPRSAEVGARDGDGVAAGRTRLDNGACADSGVACAGGAPSLTQPPMAGTLAPPALPPATTPGEEHPPPVIPPIPQVAAARYQSALRRRGLVVQTGHSPDHATTVARPPIQQLYHLTQQALLSSERDIAAILALRPYLIGPEMGATAVICDLPATGGDEAAATTLSYRTVALSVALMRGWPRHVYRCALPLSPIPPDEVAVPPSSTTSLTDSRALTPTMLYELVAGASEELTAVIVVSPHGLPSSLCGYAGPPLLWWRPTGRPLVREASPRCTEVHGFHAKLFAAIVKGAPPTLEGIVHEELARYTV